MTALALKKHELSRRAANLPKELAQWRTATEQVVDLNAHSSQLEAIDVLFNTVVAAQGPAAAALDPQGDEGAFYRGSLKVMLDIARAEKLWGYFRDKLELRYSPLQGQTVEALLPFTAGEDARIRSAMNYFRTAHNPPNQLPLRHVPAAAAARPSIRSSSRAFQTGCSHDRARDPAADAGVRAQRP